MTAEQRQNRIITGFILLSLLLHLLLLLVPKDRLFPVEKIDEPVYVEVRPMQPLQQKKEYELDLPIRKELEKPRETPAKRLAERDQVVEREMAPKGSDSEDRPKTSPAPKSAPARAQPQQRQTESVQQQDAKPPSPTTPEGWQPMPEEKTASQLPDLKELTRISPTTLAQIESDWRSKYRQDVEQGDTVWMDSQQDLLASFMRRFRDNIYNVWNYPAPAIERMLQGTCLLRITVDRRGNVLGVDLLESSGSSLLDEEAMTAVRQGASYGPLPRAYPHDALKIMAFFQYRLGGVVDYSRRRPGWIR